MFSGGSWCSSIPTFPSPAGAFKGPFSGSTFDFHTGFHVKLWWDWIHAHVQDIWDVMGLDPCSGTGYLGSHGDGYLGGAGFSPCQDNTRQNPGIVFI